MTQAAPMVGKGMARQGAWRPPSGRLAALLILPGSAALLTAAAWWWIAFRVVIDNGSLSARAAVPCLVASSDRCTLALALCDGRHWFGIRHYDPTLFWIAVAVVLAALLPRAHARASARRPG